MITNPQIEKLRKIEARAPALCATPKGLVDHDAWEESGELQDEGRDYIAKMAKNYKP